MSFQEHHMADLRVMSPLLRNALHIDSSVTVLANWCNNSVYQLIDAEPCLTSFNDMRDRFTISIPSIPNEYSRGFYEEPRFASNDTVAGLNECSDECNESVLAFIHKNVGSILPERMTKNINLTCRFYDRLTRLATKFGYHKNTNKLKAVALKVKHLTIKTMKNKMNKEDSKVRQLEKEARNCIINLFNWYESETEKENSKETRTRRQGILKKIWSGYE